jgi:amidohydrolase
MRDIAGQEIRERFEQNLTQIKQWRRDIHKHPELAFEECRTAEIVAEKLKSWGIEVHTGLAKTGVVGVLKGKTDLSGRSVGLRADMDALSIHEDNDFAHKSVHEGAMHACGHDGHTTMLLVAAEYLAETRNFDGTIYFIFQPAEEGDKNGRGGGQVMVEEGLFEQFKIDRVFGLHNWPELEAGKMAICAGPMTASTDGFEIIVHGKGGHAAMPHLHVDSVLVASTIVVSLHGMISSNTRPQDGNLLSVCQVNGGSSDSAMPEQIVLKGTVRCFGHESRASLEKNIRQISEAISSAHGARSEVIYHHGYPSVVNTEAETEMAWQAALSVVGAENVETFKPTMGGEDFAYMLEKRPGAYIALGQAVGNVDQAPGLHSGHYDFNDNVAPTGAAYWVSLAEQILTK